MTGSAGERAAAGGTSDEGRCCFCGEALGSSPAGNAGGPDEAPCCVLCGLVRHLDRPHIDGEARLIWLPEMTQPVLNCVVRTIHCRLRALGESVLTDATPRRATAGRGALWHAEQALLARSDAVEARLGSARPSDLAEALFRLAEPAREMRGRLLAGVRVLPQGRFFAGSRDVYPEIVDGWCKSAVAAAASMPPGAAGRS